MQEPLPLEKRWALGLSFLSALLLILAFPYTRLVWLSFVALVPLMLALRGQGWRRGLLVGLVHGFVFQSYIMWWANFFGFPAFLFLAGYKALLPTLFGALWGELSRRHPSRFPVAFVFGWVGLEYLQTFGPFGVTWGMLSHTWARTPVVLQSCSLLGPWIGSLLLLVCNAAIFQWLRPAPRPGRRAWLGVAGLLLLVNGLYGAWRLDSDFGPGQTVTVASVQVSMGRDVRWDPAFAEVALARLRSLSTEAATRGARFIVWPETAIPYRGFLKSPQLSFQIAMLARELKAWLVVGSIEKVGDEHDHTLNSASLISPDGAYEGRYDKQRLVPGGEYLPLESWLRPYKIFDRVMRYLPGQGNGVLHCPDLGIRPGLLICFESMVPFLARDRVRDGCDLLVVPTNDGWFGANPAIQHHFEMAIFRAIEQGRPLVQCGNTGVSGMIDERGRVLVETPIDEMHVIVSPVVARTGVTLYHRVGDILPGISLLIFFLAGVWPKGANRAKGKD